LLDSVAHESATLLVVLRQLDSPAATPAMKAALRREQSDVLRMLECLLDRTGHLLDWRDAEGRLLPAVGSD
jgi:hypothetical protein